MKIPSHLKRPDPPIGNLIATAYLGHSESYWDLNPLVQLLDIHYFLQLHEKFAFSSAR